MLKLATFFCFLVPIFSIKSGLLKFIEDNIDDTVDPCDDFYRHACAKNKPGNQTTSNFLKQEYSKILESVELPENLKFAKKITATDSPFPLLNILHNRNQSASIAKIVHYYSESCKNNDKTTLKSILSRLTSTFPNTNFNNLIFDRNCERASRNLKTNFQKAWNEKIKKYEESLENMRTIINNIQSNIWYSNNSDLIGLHDDLFEEFRQNIIELIQNTPWITLTDTVKAFDHLGKQMNFTNCIEDGESDIETLLNMNSSLEKCRSSSSIESMNILCYFETGFSYVYNMRELNAYNLHPKICIFHSSLSSVNGITSPGLFYGTSGLTMAHEIGHTFVKSKRDTPFLPDFPNNFKICVQEQFNSTCSLFKEKKCDTQDEQFDENGSDIFASVFTYDIMKKKYGEKLKEVVPGSKYNLTNAELYFYASSQDYCSRTESQSFENDPHHANNARVNAGVVQVPDFQRIFQCDKDSRMMRSKTKQCHLFGEQALH